MTGHSTIMKTTTIPAALSLAVFLFAQGHDSSDSPKEFVFEGTNKGPSPAEKIPLLVHQTAGLL